MLTILKNVLRLLLPDYRFQDLPPSILRFSLEPSQLEAWIEEVIFLLIALRFQVLDRQNRSPGLCKFATQ
jgi:hypothetical protein